jgi:hypothetical protein
MSWRLRGFTKTAASLTIALFLGSLLLPGHAEPPPAWLVSGKETPVTWLGSKTGLCISRPKDYAADRAWPVLFYFHGTSGHAST